MSETTKKKFSFPRIHPHDIVTILFAVLIVFINFNIVGKCYNPFVYNDEMGYWTHAATMAGYDWRGVSSTLAWYSFGYSFMLVPIIKLFGSSVAMYRAALSLNIIMQTAVYFMYIYILRFIFPKLKKTQTSFIAAAAVLYTSYQHNAGIAFSETALLFVTSLIAFTIVRVIKSPSYLNLGCLGALCAYIFMIHNRTIGVVASVVLVVVLAVIFKKVKLRHAAVFIAVLAIGFAANSLIRHQLESYLWISGKAGGNDSGSVFGKIKMAFSSVDGIKRMLSLFASQAFAAFAATFGIALFSLWSILRRLIGELTNTVRSFKKKKSNCRLPENSFYIILFIFCSFISTWIISSVFMFDFERIDHVIYTRYYDIAIGFLIMTGFYYMLCADKKDFLFIMFMPAVMLIGANRASALMNSVKFPVFSRVCSPGVSWYFEKFNCDFYAYAAVSLTIFGILMLIMNIKKYNIGVYLASLLTIALFMKYTDAARIDIFNNQKVYGGDRDLVARVKEMPHDTLYIMPNVGTFASFLQFMNVSERIEYAYNKEKISENALIFADKSDIINLRDYEVVDTSDRHILIRNKIVNDNEDFSLPLSYMNTFDYSYYIADEDIIESNPANNYVCYGPYLNLDIGEYTFSLDMDFDKISGENIGFAEIRSGSVNTVYDHIEITDDMISKDGSLDIDLNANVGVSISDMEIVVFLYEPTEISMQLNSIQVDTKE